MLLLPNTSREPGEDQRAEVLGSPKAKLGQGRERAFLLNRRSKSTASIRSTSSNGAARGSTEDRAEVSGMVVCPGPGELETPVSSVVRGQTSLGGMGF